LVDFEKIFTSETVWPNEQNLVGCIYGRFSISTKVVPVQCTVKPVLRGHHCDKDRWPHKRGSIHMKFSMTGQEKCDILIQVAA
jgi:hypothetical protein